MNIPGYDAWKLRSPDEDHRGPSCDYCGDWRALRVACPGHYFRGRNHPPEIVCKDCFTGQDDGPCFDDLQTVAEYAEELEDVRADYLHDRQRDERAE